MIGLLKGTIEEIENNHILLDTHFGVSYKVFLPAIVLKNLSVGTKVRYYIHFHVRENEISLYGFPDKKFLQVFNILLSIPSIGPKSALNIIGYNKLEKLIEAVQAQNSSYFSQIPGIGKKTSQKILLELSNKFEVEFAPEKKSTTQEDKLVIDALISLGFNRHEAYTAISDLDSKLSLEAKITQAIKNLNTDANKQ